MPANLLLATDLDGTLIPLRDNRANRANLKALTKALQRHDRTLLYVTGRHLESAMEALHTEGLPQPDWIICDVGTTICKFEAEDTPQIVDAYRRHQESVVSGSPRSQVKEALQQLNSLELQEPVKQSPFKLSYYTDAGHLVETTRDIEACLARLEARWELTASIDPFNGDGLIDLLPQGISKADALRWWVDYTNRRVDDIVFAGDSGNDLTALTAGYFAILVGNADRQLAARVQQQHRENGWENRLYLAERHATSGVLEGCRHFGLIEPTS